MILRNSLSLTVNYLIVLQGQVTGHCIRLGTFIARQRSGVCWTTFQVSMLDCVNSVLQTRASAYSDIVSLVLLGLA